MINSAIQQLRQQRNKLETEIQNLSQAIKALERLGTGSAATVQPRKRRKMSAAARARIGKAQRARWAKFHAQKAKK